MPSLVELGSVVLEKKFLNLSCQLFFYYFPIISFGKGIAFHLTKTWIPFTQGYFEPSLVEIGPVVLEKTIFKSCQFIFIISQYLAFGKGVALHLNKLESPSSRDTFCQVWLKLAQWFRRWWWKCEKFTLRRTDRQMQVDWWSE